MSTQYEPNAVVGTLLIDGKTRKPIFGQLYCAGCSDARDLEVVASDPNSRFENFEAIIANVEGAGQQIRNEHARIVPRFVEEIKPAILPTPVPDHSKEKSTPLMSEPQDPVAEIAESGPTGADAGDQSAYRTGPVYRICTPAIHSSSSERRSCRLCTVAPY